jgi:hypothetical protein
MAAADTIVLDTIGKLYAHGHGLNGPCRRFVPRAHAGARRGARRR